MESQTLSRNQDSDCASLLDAAFDFGLTPSEFKVYYCLMRSLESDRCSKMSMDKLALQCQIRSRNTVKRALDALIQMGMIRRLSAKNGYVHQLTEPLDWARRSMEQKLIDQKLTRQNLIDEQEQASSSNNPYRVIADEAVVKCEQEEQKLNRAKIEQGSAIPRSEIALLPEAELKVDDLESKIAAARILGCNVGICWDREEMFVRLDGALKTVGDFLAMPLEALSQSVHLCQSGLDLCRAQIEKIKERLKNQRLTRLERLAASG